MKIWLFHNQGRISMRGIGDDGSRVWIRGEIGPGDLFAGLAYEQLTDLQWIETDDAGEIVRTDKNAKPI